MTLIALLLHVIHWKPQPRGKLLTAQEHAQHFDLHWINHSGVNKLLQLTS
jgi:hypothetical protein